MNPLETYLKDLRDIRTTGAAVAETSFYHALSNLFNEIGKTLKPKVRCVMPIADRGADLEPIGGGFRYCTLAEPLFDEAGTIRPQVTFADLAAHVFFTETGEPIPKRTNGRTPLLGVCNATAYYLLFNGILGDKRPDGGNVLTGKTLAQLPAHDGPKIVYGEGCRLGRTRLKRERITFKQVPYEIKTA